MAGSAFRPLTNIPYCCLPQESGPCLSTSVGDRPLRSPTHRRLGGPSPRLPPNGTHARPRPPSGFIHVRMPSHGTMAYYPAFPPAIRLSGVGCIRVAHPCATLKAPEGAYPVRLACIRPAASVHPEPGSNSSLYYCCTQIFLLNLGFRLDVLLVFLLKGSFPDAASQRRRYLVLASDFQRTFRFRVPLSSSPLPFRKRVQKYYLFPIPQALFSIIFLLFCIMLIVSVKIFRFGVFSGKTCTLIY